MDPYIKHFSEDTKIQTYTLENAYECNEVYKINSAFENFKILTLNIRSINKNLTELEIFLEQFIDKFECMVLTETWIINIEYIKLEGYTALYNEGTFNQNDGVVIFLKNSLEFSHKIVNINQCKVLNVKVNYNIHTFNIMGIYRLHDIKLKDFLIDLDLFFKANIQDKDNYIFTGDLNINLSEENHTVNEYLNIMAEYGFISLINGITRKSGNAESSIDHIFLKSNTTLEEKVIPIIVQTQITDHYPVAAQFILNKKKIQQNSYKKYIKQINFKKLNQDLNNINWDVALSGDPELATDSLITILQNKIEENTILKKIKSNKIKRKPWITAGLINSINYRDKLLIRYYRTQDQNLKLEYNLYRNRLNKLINKAKNEYFKDKINRSTNNKNLWETINNLKNKQTHNNVIKTVHKNKSIVSNTKEIANIFNSHYINMGGKLANKIKETKEYKENRLTLNNTMFVMPTCPNEIKKIINKLKNKKSIGIDNISVDTIKKISESIAAPLSTLINNIFTTGICPMFFKTSIIIPIFKKGDKQDPVNYRPISLITNIAKIFESLLKTRLDSYIKTFKIISDNQYGFQKGKSTTDAITTLIKDIYEAVDKNTPTICIFLDLAKAFDTVNHKKLLNALENIGIRGALLKLFSNYLRGRCQYVRIGSTLSEPKNPSHGVPQGTILGPILFLIYINNLFRIKTKGKILSFADDTTVFYKENTWSALKSLIEKDFIAIKEWFDHNILTINMEKTNFMAFGSYSHSLPAFKSLNFKNSGDIFKIRRTESAKFLGITLDPHLRWDLQVQQVTKKIRCIIPFFKLLKPILSTQQLNMIYDALVESHIRYGILGWGGVFNKQLRDLEIIQKRILKIIYNVEMTFPTDELFLISGKMDCRQIFYLNLLIYTHARKKVPLKTVHTRQKNNLPVPKMKKTIGQRCFSYLGPKVYNELPENLKNNLYSKSFKKMCIHYVMQHPRQFINNQIDLKNCCLP